MRYSRQWASDDRREMRGSARASTLSDVKWLTSNSIQVYTDGKDGVCACKMGAVKEVMCSLMACVEACEDWQGPRLASCLSPKERIWSKAFTPEGTPQSLISFD